MTTRFLLYKLLKQNNVQLPEILSGSNKAEVVFELMFFLFPHDLEVYLKHGYYNGN